jgi:Calcineurin-like phosphoesterase
LTTSPIPALQPRGDGHQFVCYADSCSGVPGARHATTFASVNAVVRRLQPQPEFIAFPGDEIIGLTADDDVLRRQWRFWLDEEMGWLDRTAIPLYHTTGNHTSYDRASEAIFREMLSYLPRNGPPGQEGLTYVVRRGDLLMVFINTLTSERGGEGRVESDWLERTLAEHADARFKLVYGHHPVFSVNGFSGPYQREIGPEDGKTLWQVLVRHGVVAYVCSHILAFDVQVHEGVLQILTAGAGTAHRMPEEFEYLHCLQAALDGEGLRYQVLDTAGIVRESLSWPFALPDSTTWQSLQPEQLISETAEEGPHLIAWRWDGTCAADGRGDPQTLIAGWTAGGGLAGLWVGLTGETNQVTILVSPQPGRSPHRWNGPALRPGEPFSLQIALHPGMGPGGLLWRWDDQSPWSSLVGASPWGIERLVWPDTWAIGHGQRGTDDQPFRGSDLRSRYHRAYLPNLWGEQ